MRRRRHPPPVPCRLPRRLFRLRHRAVANVDLPVRGVSVAAADAVPDLRPAGRLSSVLTD